MEDRIEDNDMYERRDTLVFSGAKLPVQQPNEDTSGIIAKLLKDNLNFPNLPNSEISVSHRLSSRDTKGLSGRSPIIVKFCRRHTKVDILNRARKKKPENLFINEHLTPMQATISFVLRKAKQDFPDLVSGSTTFDGANFVWIQPPNPAARGAKALRMKITSHRKLDEFCTNTLKKPLTEYIPKWIH